MDRGRLEGPCPARLRQASWEAGISGTAQWPGKQAFSRVHLGVLVTSPKSALECAKHPQTPLASCSDAKDSRGHTAPGSISARQPAPPGRGVAGPAETQVPMSLPPRFGPKGWGCFLWAPGEGARRDEGGGRILWDSRGSGTADLPPAAAPRSQAILL